MVGTFGIARDLVAQHTAGLRMLRIALHTSRHAIFDRGQQRAGVGAIVRARADNLRDTAFGFSAGEARCSAAGRAHALTL